MPQMNAVLGEFAQAITQSDVVALGVGVHWGRGGNCRSHYERS